MSNTRPYTIKSLKLGCEVIGIDLNQDTSSSVINWIKRDVTEHRLLVFRNQGIISGERHVEISRWFGPLESTFYKHPKSPHSDIFRVSNLKSEGCTGVGRTGWHIDGSFMECPFSYSLYHMVSVPETGDTVFAPLNELIGGLGEQMYEKWNRLWMISDRRNGPIHPLIYEHPITARRTLCFHLGMTDGFIWDFESTKQREASNGETMQILKEIHNEFVKDDGAILYSHKLLGMKHHLVHSFLLQKLD